MTLETVISAAGTVAVFAMFVRIARQGQGGLRPFLHPRALIAGAAAAASVVVTIWAAKQVDLGQAGEASQVSLSTARTVLIFGMGSFAIALGTALSYGVILRRRYAALLERLTHLIEADAPTPALTGDSANDLRRLKELVPWMFPEGRDRDRLMERITELGALPPD